MKKQAYELGEAFAQPADLGLDEQRDLLMSLKHQLKGQAAAMLDLAEGLEQFGSRPLNNREKATAQMAINSECIAANSELAASILLNDSEGVERHFMWLQKQMALKDLFN